MKTIEQTVSFTAPPAAVYEALLNSDKHAAFTGEPANIDPRVGGSASAYGGKVTAINLELVEGSLIVQAWRPANLPPGVFTLVRYDLAAKDGGTELKFSQSSIPDEIAPHLESGWKERYWTPLTAYFTNR